MNSTPVAIAIGIARIADQIQVEIALIGVWHRWTKIISERYSVSILVEEISNLSQGSDRPGGGHIS